MQYVETLKDLALRGAVSSAAARPLLDAVAGILATLDTLIAA